MTAQEITQGPLRAVSPGQRQERPTALKTPSLKSTCFRRFCSNFSGFNSAQNQQIAKEEWLYGLKLHCEVKVTNG